MLETWSSVFKNLKEGKFLNDDNYLPEPYEYLVPKLYY